MFRNISRIAPRIARLLVLAVLLSGCELNLGGVESVAADYVRQLVEQPASSEITEELYRHMPNKAVVEYARALYVQGIKQDYVATKLQPSTDLAAKVSVSIVPRRSPQYAEREHVLIVDLRKEDRKGWRVTGVSALP